MRVTYDSFALASIVRLVCIHTLSIDFRWFDDKAELE